MQNLINWYQNNKRDLPWRRTKDPYKIWLSEIILQQTRIEQGTAYYNRFVETFPNVKSLASAHIDQVLMLWQGLGYYSRARNLHLAAKFIVNECGGEFPDNYVSLLKLKGVGDYTASAIASIAFNQAEAVVDGNVYRVLSRYYAEKTPIDSTKGKRLFRELAQDVLDKRMPGMHNEALMELGATVCKPTSPACDCCPINESCEVAHSERVLDFPVKEKKVRQKNRYMYFGIIRYQSRLYIEKREKADIWKGLYQFPCLDFYVKPLKQDLVAKFYSTYHIDKGCKHGNFSKEIVHVLSHQKIHAQFVEIRIEEELNKSRLLSIDFSDIDNYAMPRLITRYLETYSL